MILEVLGSGSAGNCYLLKSKQDTLLLECGVGIKAIKHGLNYDLSRVAGVVITHEHGDHCKAIKKVTGAGMDVYATAGTIKAMKVISHRIKPVKLNTVQKIGSFEIIPFLVQHNAAEPVGFLIRHQEAGTILYLTDTNYLPHTFGKLNHVLIECNYCDDILDRRIKDGSLHPVVIKHVQTGHLSYLQCKKMLLNNDLSGVNNIVLIHLSDGNADGVTFKDKLHRVTGKKVILAKKGLIMELNKNPF